MTNKERLELEIARELTDMALQDPGSMGYGLATERLAKLYQLQIDEEKREDDKVAKTKELSETKKNRWFRLGADILGISMPLVFYGAWIKEGLRFETTGAFSSSTFRTFFSKLRFTK